MKRKNCLSYKGIRNGEMGGLEVMSSRRRENRIISCSSRGTGHGRAATCFLEYDVRRELDQALLEYIPWSNEAGVTSLDGSHNVRHSTFVACDVPSCSR